MTIDEKKLRELAKAAYRTLPGARSSTEHYNRLVKYVLEHTAPELEPCPLCGVPAEYSLGFVECSDTKCGLSGPFDDPTGAKWNEMARKIRAAEEIVGAYNNRNVYDNDAFAYDIVLTLLRNKLIG